MVQWKREATLFGIGAAGYSLIEIAARGHTHWTMTLTGGMCTVALYHAHRRLRKKSAMVRCGAGAAIITSAELSVGMVVNRILGWRVWDYSDRFLNAFGQVCPRFTMYWFLLNIPLIPVFAALERWWFKGKIYQEGLKKTSV